MMPAESFKIRLSRLGDVALELERAIEPAWFEWALQGTELRLDPEVPAGVSLTLQRMADAGHRMEVLVRGRVFGRALVPCARCLGDAGVDLLTELAVLFHKGPLAGGDADPEAELDEASHDGHELDLTPIVREHILLAVPMSPLCKPECEGLCDQCGRDLNTDTCEHRERGEVEPTDPRFAVLKSISVPPKE